MEGDLESLVGEVSFNASLSPTPHPHACTQLSPGSFPSPSLCGSCSEQRPQAQTSADAQLNSPGCFNGASFSTSEATNGNQVGFLP